MPFSANDLWSTILSNLQSKINKQSFDTWFAPTRALSFSENKLVVEVPSRFFCDWLNEHYLSLLHEISAAITAEDISVYFVVSSDLQLKPSSSPSSSLDPAFTSSDYFRSSSSSISSAGTPLNAKYTFNSFVVGNSNRFAHAAALAVAESPAKSYNPLFIYGGVGLGKTHLLHAIGNFILQTSSSKRVLYVSSETFMNEMISSIGAGTMRAFRDRFRTVDVLLIDDIQFLVGKESTQEEFFHTFNDLYNVHKQIVATSDSHPKEIKLEERLRSRFEWGLVSDIQPPDFETRVAILSKKAESEKSKVPSDVLAYIANQVKSNIRELEGYLIRVIAFASLTRTDISLDLAREVLRDLFSDDLRPITIDRITEMVAHEFNLKVSDLKAKKRTASIVFPRQIAMYLSREMTDFSLPEIGKFFGGKDHTTVIYGFDKIKDKLSHDEKLRNLINRLMNQLRDTSV
ncbi:chromosomal replication initiator protein DnaA [candidate division FCPU426 bacterium]|nr:chromosomal replication initiator protein DnaA [candidate division FCPU426 bacterium]